MPVFKLLPNRGPHAVTITDKDGKRVDRLYGPGEKVESDGDLCAKFPGKFQRVSRKARKVAEDEPDEVVETETDETETQDANLGKDVTKQFEDVPEGIVIRRTGRQYDVFEGTSEVPLNERRLSKKGVEEFLETL